VKFYICEFVYVCVNRAYETIISSDSAQSTTASSTRRNLVTKNETAAWHWECIAAYEAGLVLFISVSVIYQLFTGVVFSQLYQYNVLVLKKW